MQHPASLDQHSRQHLKLLPKNLVISDSRHQLNFPAVGFALNSEGSNDEGNDGNADESCKANSDSAEVGLRSQVSVADCALRHHSKPLRVPYVEGGAWD